MYGQPDVMQEVKKITFCGICVCAFTLINLFLKSNQEIVIATNVQKLAIIGVSFLSIVMSLLIK